MKHALAFVGITGVLIGVVHLVASIVRRDQYGVLVGYDALIVGILVLK